MPKLSEAFKLAHSPYERQIRKWARGSCRIDRSSARVERSLIREKCRRLAVIAMAYLMPSRRALITDLPTTR